MKKSKEKTNKTNDTSNRRPYTLNREPCFSKRKRPCPDCTYCQGCSKDRCRLCRAPKKALPQKLSMAEQIALYERINKQKGKKKK